jgi:hypothetical protein
MLDMPRPPGDAAQIPLQPDYDLLAVTYLDFQDAGPRLRELALTVAEFRQNTPQPGRRSARKADLGAVAQAARRLRTALDKIDPRTQAEAVELGIARRGVPAVEVQVNEVGPAAPNAAGSDRKVTQVPLVRREAGPRSFLSNVADVHRLMNTLDTVAAGFSALADGETVDASGGRPQRHDALLMGLQGLRGLWQQYRPDPPTQSENARGFGAFAMAMFAVQPVGFPVGTVRGAVIDFLLGGSQEEEQSRNS